MKRAIFSVALEELDYAKQLLTAMKTGELSGLVGNAIVRANGADPDFLVEVLKTMGLKGLKQFGQ